ncbi:hypothetical protein [Sorangium sp. So ce1099]|uniref:hypothetical protein n=1 Tax=Sorangium sp. So ce1099 TaxID=3133331 RepID=UPI003F628983
MPELAESGHVALALSAVSDEQGNLRTGLIRCLHIDSFAAVRASFMGGNIAAARWTIYR